MGNLWSTPQYLNGLKFPSNIRRDFNVNDAAEKVEQLLRASINCYRLCVIAPPITAAFYLGASPKQLTALYEKWVPLLCEVWPEDDPVADSIGKFNLHEFYGNDSYEQRYYEYFRDCLTEEPHWDRVAATHMDQLWTRLCRNDMRPIIELAAGVEMDNGMIVCEALAMACTDPQGSIEVELMPRMSEESVLAVRFRKLARRALASRSYTAVVALHACAEVFLHAGLHVLSEDRELSILDALEKYISTAKGEMSIVSPEEALASEDPQLVTFTRSRLVLEYMST